MKKTTKLLAVFTILLFSTLKTSAQTSEQFGGDSPTPPGCGWNPTTLTFITDLSKAYLCLGVITTVNRYYNYSTLTPYGIYYPEHMTILQYLSGESTWAGILAWQKQGISS